MPASDRQQAARPVAAQRQLVHLSHRQRHPSTPASRPLLLMITVPDLLTVAGSFRPTACSPSPMGFGTTLAGYMAFLSPIRAPLPCSAPMLKASRRPQILWISHSSPMCVAGCWPGGSPGQGVAAEAQPDQPCLCGLVALPALAAAWAAGLGSAGCGDLCWCGTVFYSDTCTCCRCLPKLFCYQPACRAGRSP